MNIVLVVAGLIAAAAAVYIQTHRRGRVRYLVVPPPDDDGEWL